MRRYKRGTLKFVGKFPSLKLNKIVLWRSQLERDYLYLLEFDPDVVSYKEKPFLIKYIGDNQHNYVPDFLVERINTKQVVDVKPDKYTTSEENAVLSRLLISVCREQGYKFRVLTDSMIRKQPRLDNIKLLWRYARTPITPQHQILCYDFLHRRQPACFADIIQYFESKRLTREIVYALMFKGFLSFDITQPITISTLLFLPKTTTITSKVS